MLNYFCKKIIKYLWIIIVLDFLFLIIPVFGTARITGFRTWLAPEALRIVFDLNQKTSHELFVLKNPNRLVVDIKDVKLNIKLDTTQFPTGYIGNVRYSLDKKNELRVVFDLKRNLNLKSSLLPPNGEYGYRLVVDLSDKFKDKIIKDEADRHIASKKTPFVVVIDAGHGGDDPGAIGHKQTREKDIVLSISSLLYKMMDSDPNIVPILTRKKDYYIGLRERMNIAREHHADLFISIHADGFNRKSADGTSVFILSERGESSEMARWIADQENRSDLIGGVTLEDKDSMLASVLLDLSQLATKRASSRMAELVLGELGKISTLHKNHVEKAAFVVLKSPDIPSILVETGFISNPSTERKLKTFAYQQKMAKAIYSGVNKYLINKQ